MEASIHDKTQVPSPEEIVAPPGLARSVPLATVHTSVRLLPRSPDSVLAEQQFLTGANSTNSASQRDPERDSRPLSFRSEPSTSSLLAAARESATHPRYLNGRVEAGGGLMAKLGSAIGGIVGQPERSENG